MIQKHQLIFILNDELAIFNRKIEVGQHALGDEHGRYKVVLFDILHIELSEIAQEFHNGRLRIKSGQAPLMDYAADLFWIERKLRNIKCNLEDWTDRHDKIFSCRSGCREKIFPPLWGLSDSITHAALKKRLECAPVPLRSK